MPRLLLLLLSAPVLLLSGPCYAQGNIRDTTIALVAVNAGYAYQLPGGDLADRFGPNSNVGLNAWRKNKHNFLWGLEGGFIFGDQVRETGLLRNVINSQGQIVDQDGVMADVLLYQRGYTIMAIGGKIMPIAGPNPNSGIMLKVGAGYMRHKIRIQTQKNEVPNLQDDYLEGYDRLAAGPVAMLYVGYQHFGNNRMINFHAGFEMTLGVTQPLRAYNFDTQRAETDTRLDNLSGIRVGWTLPIYKRVDDRFHFY
ncbi:MAG: hypothetical protein KIT10_09085 [Flavobacteriales bacterium]|nr:hypothetical protein [Flavobacteriales bacterium]